jgi:hypothetical protein
VIQPFGGWQVVVHPAAVSVLHANNFVIFVLPIEKAASSL